MQKRKIFLIVVCSSAIALCDDLGSQPSAARGLICAAAAACLGAAAAKTADTSIKAVAPVVKDFVKKIKGPDL